MLSASTPAYIESLDELAANARDLRVGKLLASEEPQVVAWAADYVASQGSSGRRFEAQLLSAYRDASKTSRWASQSTYLLDALIRVGAQVPKGFFQIPERSAYSVEQLILLVGDTRRHQRALESVSVGGLEGLLVANALLEVAPGAVVQNFLRNLDAYLEIAVTDGPGLHPSASYSAQVGLGICALTSGGMGPGPKFPPFSRYRLTASRTHQGLVGKLLKSGPVSVGYFRGLGVGKDAWRKFQNLEMAVASEGLGNTRTPIAYLYLAKILGVSVAELNLPPPTFPVEWKSERSFQRDVSERLQTVDRAYQDLLKKLEEKTGGTYAESAKLSVRWNVDDLRDTSSNTPHVDPKSLVHSRFVSLSAR